MGSQSNFNHNGLRISDGRTSYKNNFIRNSGSNFNGRNSNAKYIQKSSHRSNGNFQKMMKQYNNINHSDKKIPKDKSTNKKKSINKYNNNYNSYTNCDSNCNTNCNTNDNNQKNNINIQNNINNVNIQNNKNNENIPNKPNTPNKLNISNFANTPNKPNTPNTQNTQNTPSTPDLSNKKANSFSKKTNIIKSEKKHKAKMYLTSQKDKYNIKDFLSILDKKKNDSSTNINEVLALAQTSYTMTRDKPEEHSYEKEEEYEEENKEEEDEEDTYIKEEEIEDEEQEYKKMEIKMSQFDMEEEQSLKQKYLIKYKECYEKLKTLCDGFDVDECMNYYKHIDNTETNEDRKIILIEEYIKKNIAKRKVNEFIDIFYKCISYDFRYNS